MYSCTWWYDFYLIVAVSTLHPASVYIIIFIMLKFYPTVSNNIPKPYTQKLTYIVGYLNCNK